MRVTLLGGKRDSLMAVHISCAPRSTCAQEMCVEVDAIAASTAATHSQSSLFTGAVVQWYDISYQNFNTYLPVESKSPQQ